MRYRGGFIRSKQHCLIVGVAVPSGIYASRAMKRELFDRVCSGQSVSAAEVAMGVSHGVGHLWWHKAGGMTFAAGRRGGVAEAADRDGPGGRGHRLNRAERVEIMRGLDAGLTQAEIGRRIGRNRSDVCKEIRRNRGDDGDYHALMAHARAGGNAKRPKPFRLANPALWAAIEAWMDDGWSPRLIAHMLAHDHRGDKLMQVSHGPSIRPSYATLPAVAPWSWALRPCCLSSCAAQGSGRLSRRKWRTDA